MMIFEGRLEVYQVPLHDQKLVSLQATHPSKIDCYSYLGFSFHIP